MASLAPRFRRPCGCRKCKMGREDSRRKDGQTPQGQTDVKVEIVMYISLKMFDLLVSIKRELPEK